MLTVNSDMAPYIELETVHEQETHKSVWFQ